MITRESLSQRLGFLPSPYNPRLAAAKAKAIERFGVENLLEFTIGDPPLKSEEFRAVLAGYNGVVSPGYMLPTWGSHPFLRAIADFRERVDHVQSDPDLGICGVRGARLALTVAMLAFTNPGDAVLYSNLNYPGGWNGIVNARCQAELYDVRPEVADVFEQIQMAYERAIEQGKKVKLVVVTSPGNPHGRVHDAQFYKKLISFCYDRNLPVLSDEAYLQNVFTGKRAYSLMQFDGGSQVGVSLRTFSKLRNYPDIRAAFLDGNTVMIEAFRTIVASMDYGLSDAVQRTVCHMLQAQFDGFPAQSNALYEASDFMARTTLARHGIDVWENAGGMFGAVVIPEHLRHLGSEEVRALAVEEAGVVVNPGEAHGEGGKYVLRFGYVSSDNEVTAQGASRLGHFLSTYQPAADSQSAVAVRRAVRSC